MICQMVNMLGLLFGDVLAKMIVTSAPIWSEILKHSKLTFDKRHFSHAILTTDRFNIFSKCDVITLFTLIISAEQLNFRYKRIQIKEASIIIHSYFNFFSPLVLMAQIMENVLGQTK